MHLIIHLRHFWITLTYAVTKSETLSVKEDYHHPSNHKTSSKFCHRAKGGHHRMKG